MIRIIHIATRVIILMKMIMGILTIISMNTIILIKKVIDLNVDILSGNNIIAGMNRGSLRGEKCCA